MCVVSSFMRCVGESPPIYGARKAYSVVPSNYQGACNLHYSLRGRAYIATFASYGQALTAATMAIFCEDHDYQQVFIRPGACAGRPTPYPNAMTWRQAQA
jgi:hypothetical protein